MDRTRTTAMGTPYIRESWRNHTPQARRAHNHGPLRSLYDEGCAIGFPFWRGLGASALVVAVAWVAIIAFHQAPAASDVRTPASPAPASDAVEAGVSGYRGGR